MVAQSTDDYASLIDAQESYQSLLKEQSGKFSRQDLFYLFSVLTQGVQFVKRFTLKKVAAEMALLKCVLREPMVSTASDATPQAAAQKPPVKKKVIEKQDESETETVWDEVWVNLLKRVRAEKMSAASYLQAAEPIERKDDVVVIMTTDIIIGVYI